MHTHPLLIHLGKEKAVADATAFTGMKSHSGRTASTVWVLLVGLLTCMFRRIARQRIPFAFPVAPLQRPVTCFRRKRACSILTATESNRMNPLRRVQRIETCSGFTPDSLVQPNKMRVPLESGVAHVPQKPEQYEVIPLENYFTLTALYAGISSFVNAGLCGKRDFWPNTAWFNQHWAIYYNSSPAWYWTGVAPKII